MIDKHFEYEKIVIDAILNIIKNNQKYLTKSENLPQLAKLGYMYNTLWYAGRVCWPTGGLLRKNTYKPIEILTEEDKEDLDENEEVKYWDCEDNPKYKIDMCEPLNEKIENLIYDAWGMHVYNLETSINFESFYKLIKEGRIPNDFDVKMLKVNKTFDEWVDVLTDSRYKYQYENRKSVANHLLCTLGGGYSLNKDGFIISEASGAEQDITLYGDWENAIFCDDIQKIIDDILILPEVKLTLDTYAIRVEKQKKEEEKKEEETNELFYKILKNNNLYKEEEGKLHWKEIHRRLEATRGENKIEKYSTYYPISSSSHIYAILDKETRDRLGVKEIHESYIKESIKICQDILAHEKEETEGYNRNDSNVVFAKKFLFAYGYNEYENDVEKEIDKYALEKEIKKCFKPILKHFIKNKSKNNTLNVGEYSYYFNNTKNNQYGTNSYYFKFKIDTKTIEKGYYNNIECLKYLPFYADIKDALEKLSKLEGIETIKFYFDNIFDDEQEISISILREDLNYELDFENYLTLKGFQIGNNSIKFKLMNGINLITSKPKVLHNEHSHNLSGIDCFSLNKQFQVYDNDYNEICRFQIDERNANYISLLNSTDSNLSKWILKEHANMKKCNPDYGTFEFKNNKQVGSDGKISLYAHDFFIWLKENIENYEHTEK